MDLITTIHYNMPKPYNEPQLEKLEFNKEIPNEPKIREVKKPSFFKALFFPSSKQKYQSVKFNKSDFSKLNFEKIELIDPIKAFDNFENIKKMTETGIFKKIEPFQTN